MAKPFRTESYWVNKNGLSIKLTFPWYIPFKKRRLRQALFLAEMTVSDHAIVRYLERVIGIDIEACKKEMLSKLPSHIENLEKPVFIALSPDSKLQYVIRDNLIISVTPVGEKQ